LVFNCTFANCNICPLAIEMNFTYPKNEKLKSKITIGLLFTDGKSVSKYPLRLVYRCNAPTDGQKIKMGVSVSKKNFKKAVDRNYFKRILRETYRLNKHILVDNLDKPYAFMLFYQTKDRLSYDEINTKTIQLFEKFVAQNVTKDQADVTPISTTE
jgi:ribonuclease P protein component